MGFIQTLQPLLKALLAYFWDRYGEARNYWVWSCELLLVLGLKDAHQLFSQYPGLFSTTITYCESDPVKYFMHTYIGKPLLYVYI